jgi:hypothetical protein
VIDGRLDGVRFLASRGADLNIKSASGKSLVECAPAPETKRLLVELGATP